MSLAVRGWSRGSPQYSLKLQFLFQLLVFRLKAQSSQLTIWKLLVSSQTLNLGRPVFRGERLPESSPKEVAVWLSRGSVLTTNWSMCVCPQNCPLILPACLASTALKRVPQTSEQEAEVGSMWAIRNTSAFCASKAFKVLICLSGMVWSWIRYKLMLSQKRVLTDTKDTFLPSPFSISTTFTASSGQAVGSTWWSGRYSLLPQADIIGTFNASANLPSTISRNRTTVSLLFSHSLCAEQSPVKTAASTLGTFSWMQDMAESKSLRGASHLGLPNSGAWLEGAEGKPCSAWQQMGKSHQIEALAVQLRSKWISVM